MHRNILLVCSLMSIGLNAVGTTAALGDATVVKDNPVGPVYTANLLDKQTTNLRGSITGTAADDGVGVMFHVDFSGFPDESTGPFIYHIHDQPLPADGNCTKTLAHLDPFIRGEDPPCDAANPETCQVGDLSGKHGRITNVGGGNHFVADYLDLYASTKPTIGAFFGNRSIVVHFANKTRINCANFTLAGCKSGGSTPTTTTCPATLLPSGVTQSTAGPTPSTANGTKPTKSPPPSQGIASRGNALSVFAGIAVVALIAFAI